MACKDMRAKLQLIMQRLGKTETDNFADLVHRDTEHHEGHKLGIRKDVAQNWFTGDNVEMRGRNSNAFVAFCARHHIPFDRGDFSTSFKAFEKKFNEHKPDDAPTPAGSHDGHYLIGRYQIIRPYVTSSTAYILEPMEIELHGGQLRHLLVSHNRPEQEYLYSGVAVVEPRYYFALLSRKHEQLENAQAHRCITFYTDHPHHKPCLSGIMLRGVSGANGKYAAAVPFVALRISETKGLQGMKQVAIKNPVSEDYPLHRTHPGSNLLIGEVREHWYKPLYDICHAVFSDEKFLKGTNNSGKTNTGDPVLKTVVPDVLKDISSLNPGKWHDAVEAAVKASL